jgi:putative endonuclease
LSRRKGEEFEDKAISYLQDNDFTIVDRNFYAKKLGEIDIIAKKDDVYHFIEVKSGESFEAVYNITKTKLSRLKRSVAYYIQTKKIQQSYCIDAMIYSLNDMEYLENITL